MKKGAGIEKMQEDMEISIVGIDNTDTLDTIKQRLCQPCKQKLEKYASGDHSDDQLCNPCTALIQSILGNKLL
jgi:hypothetical protein